MPSNLTSGVTDGTVPARSRDPQVVSRRAQLHERHVRRRANPHWGSPEARAVGHVDRHAIDLTEPAHDGLTTGPDDELKWRDLAAVRVPRQLQVDAVPGSVMSLDRLVCQQ